MERCHDWVIAVRLHYLVILCTTPYHCEQIGAIWFQALFSTGLAYRQG